MLPALAVGAPAAVAGVHLPAPRALVAAPLVVHAADGRRRVGSGPAAGRRSAADCGPLARHRSAAARKLIRLGGGIGVGVGALRGRLRGGSLPLRLLLALRLPAHIARAEEGQLQHQLDSDHQRLRPVSEPKGPPHESSDS